MTPQDARPTTAQVELVYTFVADYHIDSVHAVCVECTKSRMMDAPTAMKCLSILASEKRIKHDAGGRIFAATPDAEPAGRTVAEQPEPAGRTVAEQPEPAGRTVAEQPEPAPDAADIQLDVDAWFLFLSRAPTDQPLTIQQARIIVEINRPPPRSEPDAVLRVRSQAEERQLDRDAIYDAAIQDLVRAGGHAPPKFDLPPELAEGADPEVITILKSCRPRDGWDLSLYVDRQVLDVLPVLLRMARHTPAGITEHTRTWFRGYTGDAGALALNELFESFLQAAGHAIQMDVSAPTQAEAAALETRARELRREATKPTRPETVQQVQQEPPAAPVRPVPETMQEPPAPSQNPWMHGIHDFNVDSLAVQSGRNAVYLDDISGYEDAETFDARSGNAYAERIVGQAYIESCEQYGHVLPGHGASKYSCQQWRYLGCLDHADMTGTMSRKLTLMSCNLMTCPKCFARAIHSRAMAATERLFAHAVLLQSRLSAQYRKNAVYTHFVVSLSAENAERAKTPDGLRRIIRSIRKDLRALGYLGGMEVYHPWRYTKGLETNYYSPHYHFILSGYMDVAGYKAEHAEAIKSDRMAKHPAEEMYRRTGNVYRVISTLYTNQDVYGVVSYLLSHAGIPLGRKQDGGNHGTAIEYWGTCATRQFSTQAVLAKEILYDVGEPQAEQTLADAQAESRRYTVGEVLRGQMSNEINQGYVLDHADLRTMDTETDWFAADLRRIRAGPVERVDAGAVRDRVAELLAVDNAPTAPKSNGGEPPAGEMGETVETAGPQEQAGPEPRRSVVVRLALIEKQYIANACEVDVAAWESDAAAYDATASEIMQGVKDMRQEVRSLISGAKLIRGAMRIQRICSAAYKREAKLLKHQSHSLGIDVVAKQSLEQQAAVHDATASEIMQGVKDMRQEVKSLISSAKLIRGAMRIQRICSAAYKREAKLLRLRFMIKYLVISADQSIEPLCHVCWSRLRPVIPKSGQVPPPNPDDVGVQDQYRDASQWEYWDPLIHYDMGLPYIDPNGELRWDGGLAIPHPAIKQMSPAYAAQIMDHVHRTHARYVARLIASHDESLRHDRDARSMLQDVAMRVLRNRGIPTGDVEQWGPVLARTVWSAYTTAPHTRPDSPAGQSTLEVAP